MPEQRSGKPPLVALIAAACVIASPIVARFEGKRNQTYADRLPGFVLPTTCYGHTGPDVKMGQFRTDAECAALLDADLRKHAGEVASCVPKIFDRPKVAAAAISLSYNIGGRAFCRSTAAKRFQAGDYRGGCAALGWFNKAGGKVLPGLVKRRAAEVKLCLEGVG